MLERRRCCAGCHKATPLEGVDPFYSMYTCEKGTEGYVHYGHDLCWHYPYETYPETYIEEFCEAYQDDA